jgi:hypothetical protein
MSKRDTLSKMSINDMVKMIDEDKGESNSWTVWVGGSEVNSEYLSQERANYAAGYWIGRGYDDVIVEEISK